MVAQRPRTLTRTPNGSECRALTKIDQDVMRSVNFASSPTGLEVYDLAPSHTWRMV
ncbi:predicted protein [Plenodomus lingam JN3]|uniref:Predicted protein n=1 Tax=Leptosphaeria maculans (strain JN3 / isolate v23.1.3 / race Av1-4-5-6-7-8) TaxID=985895 RepID=E4ZLX8_LEPMJ|nr:predicted protein [Plenodomus lingam JN3]CBX92808.1 predicted protein [Plenodomus lingam JN3]